MIKKIFGIMILFIAFVSLAFSELPEELKKNKNLNKTTINNQWRKIALNNLEMWFSNNGMGSQDPVTGNNGLMFPKGSGMGVIYIDGPILSGLVSGSIRMQGSTYNTSLQAGPAVVGVNPADPQYRVYMIKKDLYKLKDDEVFLTGPNYTKADFVRDSTEWPIDMGAPSTIVGGSRVPKLIGDEQAWFVMNDYNPGSGSFYGTVPCGTEWHSLVWAYDLSGALGNVIFKKYTIINKGNDPIEEAYLTYWSDPDLGEATDDLVGCDTVLKMGYVYNGGAADAIYGIGCPAVGYTYLQGPTVKSDDPNDVANWNFGYKQGYKNLPMTSFTFFANSSSGLGSEYTDPAFTYAGSVEFYNLIKGLKKNGSSWIDEITSQPTNFLFPGDPTSRKGWIDGGKPTGFNPRDVRMSLSSGPFTLAVGDTQELVVGIVVGQGPDRLSSISVMKFYNLQVQKAYDDNFDLASAPPRPVVTAAELPNAVSLHWGDPANYIGTESYNEKGYKFGGYVVYQLPKASSTKSEAKRLATFDLEDGHMIIFDSDIDPNSGAVVSLPVILGNDQGIKREFFTDYDFIRDRALVNGQTYYFAVTAFAFTDEPNVIPVVLENPINSSNVIAVTPQHPKNGMIYNTKVGNELEVASVGTPTHGEVTIRVVDPLRVTGHNYDITFDTTGHVAWDEDEEEYYWETEVFWKLTDKTNGKELFRSFNQDAESDDFPIIDGLYVKVTGPSEIGLIKDYDDLDIPRGFRFLNDPTNNVTYGSGHRFFNPQAAANFGTMFQCYGKGYVNVSSVGWPAMPGQSSQLFFNTTVGAGDLKNVEVHFNSDKSKWQKAYRYVRLAQNAAADPSYIIVNRVNYGYQDFVDVPFTVWDVDANPPRQLAAGFVENNAAYPLGNADGKWRPTDYYGSSTQGQSLYGREFLLIFASSYTATPQTYYMQNTDGSVKEILNGVHDMMYSMLLSPRAASYERAGFPGDDGASGIDVKVGLFPFKPNNRDTKFNFTAPTSPSYSEEQAKFDVKNITVFPNPYYGRQVFETNKFNKFITFSRLPKKATIKIYTLAGEFVRTIEKDDESQFITWDLKNHNKLSVASGMYIAHIDMPELGEQKILKIAIIMEQQLLDKI